MEYVEWLAWWYFLTARFCVRYKLLQRNASETIRFTPTVLLVIQLLIVVLLEALFVVLLVVLLAVL